MVAKIHPEQEDKESGKAATEEKKHEESEIKKEEKVPETKEGDNENGNGVPGAEFISVSSILDAPLPQIEPKSPSKPRQKGIGLENMKTISYLQIQQTNRHMEDFANVQNNYDVQKSDKATDTVFYGMESTAPEVRVKVQSSTIASQAFSLKLIDRDDGSELLLMDRNGLNDIPTLVYRLHRLRKKEPIGAIMLQFGWRKLAPTFSIFDQNGNPWMKLIGPAASQSILGKVVYAKETTFVAYKSDDESRIGTIVKPGDIFEENKKPSTEEEIIKINFEDKSLDNLSKAMILCAAFVLDYTQFKPPSTMKKITSLLCFSCM